MQSFSQIKQEARKALEAPQPAPGKITAIHTGVIVAAALILTGLQFLLSLPSPEGGLSNLGASAFWETLQALLSLANTLILPFWQAGLVFCAILWARGQSAQPRELSQGLHRWGPMLRLYLLKGILLLPLLMVSGYAASFLFVLTPLSQNLMELLTPLMSAEDPLTALSGVPTAQLFEATLPLFVLMGILLCVLFVAVMYRCRLADYLILSGATNSALMALGLSRQLLRGHVLELLRLDLTFWWFYGASLVLNLLMLLPAFALPESQTALSLVCYGVYLAGTFLLYWKTRAKVETVYALYFLRKLPSAPENTNFA